MENNDRSGYGFTGMSKPIVDDNPVTLNACNVEAGSRGANSFLLEINDRFLTLKTDYYHINAIFKAIFLKLCNVTYL